MKYLEKSCFAKEALMMGAFDLTQQEIELVKFLDNCLITNPEFSKRVAKEFKKTNEKLNYLDCTNPYASQEVKIKDLKYLYR